MIQQFHQRYFGEQCGKGVVQSNCACRVVQYGPRLAKTGRFVSPLLLDWLFVCLQLPVKSGFCASETGHKIHSSLI
ncbi:hypothetical protein T03_13899 [Trichinella britovi]|uniref:Uncharacterized protein n=2 Tax=Trichinella TaxID=6333 RepID=A0A0V1CXC1_TRIBR|nr:hypothetical protein T09_3034 [Trichinella sp. T9]KRY21730.1 hypothetical protein T12_4404 [Trichinella patagoniensis]KRY53772.1 hypothetical protein T03_13899 [Trichinella britovi]